MTTVNLSLISHTNAGKTTLARTILQQDVGEVRDAAHVTQVATGYLMVQADDDALMLWDTPGFGDTARLVRRLRLSGNPIGWLLGQVWDRYRDKPLWSSQQAARNARDEADVILYLVNASEDPIGAAYVPLEMEVLSFIGKPVVLLLNQAGPPNAEGVGDEERWKEHLGSTGLVRGSLTLDAFARCWVQELTLLQMVEPLLPAAKQSAMRALIDAWSERNLDRFKRSMQTLARQLADTVADREEIGDRKWHDRVTGAILNPTGGEMSAAGKRAIGKLGERLDKRIRTSTDELIRLHGLSGRAGNEILARLRRDYTESAPAREGISAVLGGLASGAAGGLAADLAAGGLTLGGGMVIGSILGALGAGSAARGYNMVRGEQTNAARWSEEAFTGFVRSALLRYLAVAHFGRGRGDWEEAEHPTSWQAAVQEQVADERTDIRRIWARAKDTPLEELAAQIERLLGRCSERLLEAFYPEARRLFAGELQSPPVPA
ncbi:hypothetical protein GCM10022280_12470 [Sphingomonas swuensis]|uniref:G domain-containing protein n=1 Tax=Sphingomonas swuensis TaxID=977800 RepID=A0ABP7SQY9_9SPHN